MNDQLEQMAIMLENAAVILRSDRDMMIKLDTLERVGGTAQFLAQRGHQMNIDKMIDTATE